MTRTIFAAAALATAGFLAAPASAASFDCGRARAADERAICANRSLNDKDVRMALLWDIAPHLVGMGTRGNMGETQQAWLRRRATCGGDLRCLNTAYDRRIADLRAVIDRVVARGPF